MNSEIPKESSADELEGGGCWRWYEKDSDIAWPPVEAHRNMQVQDISCPDPLAQTFAVQRDFFYMFNPSSELRSSVERLAPTGAPYPDCASAPDHECCIAPHQIKVTAPGMQLVPGVGTDGHGTIHVRELTTTSSCNERCNLDRRIGFEGACLPGVPKCLDHENDAFEWEWVSLQTSGNRAMVGFTDTDCPHLTLNECMLYAQSIDYIFEEVVHLDNAPPGCITEPWKLKVKFNTATQLDGNNECGRHTRECVCKVPTPEERFVDLLCICGSRFADQDAISLPAARRLAVPANPNPVNTVANSPRRRLTGNWVNPYLGGHLNASKTCRSDLYDFKRRFMALGKTTRPPLMTRLGEEQFAGALDCDRNGVAAD